MGNWNDINFKGKENAIGDIGLTCPSCKDNRTNKNNSSLSVNPSKGVAKCWYCGDTFFKDSNKKKQEQINYEIPPQTWANYTNLSDGMVKWFSTRGLSQITLDDFSIGEKDIYFPSKNKEMNATVFNYFLDGTVVSEHYRSGAKDFAQMKNAVKSPYNIDSIKGRDYAIISEGEIDTMSWHEIGYESTVGVDGASHYGIIEAFKGSFDGMKIYLSTDKDYQGIEMEKKIIALFGKSRCYRMEYPPDCKDANEVLVKHGKGALLNVFSNAINVALIGDVIESTENMDYYLEKFYAGDIRKGLPLSVGTRIDNDLKFRENAFHLCVAKTNIGKSVIMFWMMLKLAQAHDVKIIMYSTENANVFIRDTLISYYLEDDTKTVSDNDHPRWSRARDFIDSHFIFLTNTKGYGLEELLDIAEAVKESKGADFLLIDPLNSLPMVKPVSGMTDYSYHVWAAARLLRFSKAVMGLIVNAHSVTGVGRSELAPKLYDVEQGAIYVNKIDVGIVFHRDINHVDADIKNTTDIWVTKLRDGRIFGGDITPFETPHKLRYKHHGFDVIQMGLYADQDADGNYV